MTKSIRSLFAALTLGCVGLAHAQLSVEIVGAGANRIPVAVTDFPGERIVSQALTSVIRSDLNFSGLFRLVDPGTTAIPEDATISYGDWKGRGADALAVGQVLPSADGRYETRFRLYDIQKQAQLGNGSLLHSSSQLRSTGHRIADFIYEKLTGVPGVFSTRIAYVVKRPGRYELQIADADGGNAQVAFASSEPIISPAWAPDGNRIAYVSFQTKKPVVYVHDLAAGRRYVAANFKGSNSAPTWSPDGQRIALVLTKDGNSQLYLINADGSGITRLASSSGIDTEPTFSPDGQSIYFTSDRGGSPQIYRIATTGGAAQRVTFQGNYNTTPRISPDGKSMAYVARNSGRFQVAVMDLASQQTQILTDSSKDESPSYAPNGRMIVYATEIGGRGVLAAVSSDGRVKLKMPSTGGDVREPAWGPFAK
ncbi:MAG TPA: Tol-Pal system beta propeller repeat protein TolB [Rhodocyclaceae bacterium]|nr:Tol-Pal system beta propeller repeat protein TolB [Rhodocyclaceae bacterium]